MTRDTSRLLLFLLAYNNPHRVRVKEAVCTVGLFVVRALPSNASKTAGRCGQSGQDTTRPSAGTNFCVCKQQYMAAFTADNGYTARRQCTDINVGRQIFIYLYIVKLYYIMYLVINSSPRG